MTKKVAIIYDFDCTLISGNMQEGFFMESFGIKKEEYWALADKVMIDNNMDSILAAMYVPIILAKERGVKFDKSLLEKSGKALNTFYKGLDTWFERINEFGSSLGLDVEHYVVSAGFRDIVENCKIAHNFKKIFSGSYIYNEAGDAVWPGHMVNYTQKTQYISRIRKNLLENLSDSIEINKKYNASDEYISYSHMIYIGDGETDVPGMRMVKENGGRGICVFEEEKQKAKVTATQIVKDGRADCALVADYSKNSELEKQVMQFLKSFANY